MPFNKLHVCLQETLEHLNITTPTPFQKNSIPLIKSGVNVFCNTKKDNGKTTTLILTTLQKLNCKASGNAPRAMVIVENKERALELYDAFLTYTRHTSLRVYVGYEQLHIDVQKSEIFMGIDILISTPRAVNQLFLQNGVPTSQLKIFCIDDTEFLEKISAYSDILSITQSIKKCQFVLFSEKMHPTLERFKSYFMEHSQIITI